MIKRYVIIFLAVVYMITLISCSNSSIAKESETPDSSINSGKVINNNETQEEILALIDNETDNSDLITQSYNVDLIRNREWSKSLEEVNKIANIECIRKVDDLVYTIYSINKGGKLFLFYEFDKESESWITCGSWYFLKPLYKEDFSKAEVDKTTADDIAEIDPTALLYPAADGVCSVHILADRSAILINYEYNDYDYDVYFVKSIIYGCDWLDWIYKNILDIDWPT